MSFETHHPDGGTPKSFQDAVRERWQGWRQHVREARPTWSWRELARGMGIALLGLIIGTAVGLYFFDWNAHRDWVARIISAQIGREVRIDGSLKVKLFSWTPSATATGVTIANPDWDKEYAMGDIGRITASIRLWPLLRGETILPIVDIHRPNAYLVRMKDGRANWDFGGATGETKIPVIERFRITNGQLQIEDRRRGLTFNGTVESDEALGEKGKRVFKLSGLGDLNRRPFTLEVQGAPLVNAEHDKPYAFNAQIKAGGTRVTAQGQMHRPLDFNSLQAAVTFAGPDLADLYYLTGLALPNTRPYRLVGQLTRDGAHYRFEKFNGTVGDSDLHGALSVDASGERVLLNADVASNVLSFDDLGPLLGAKPAPVATKVAAQVQSETGTSNNLATGGERLLPTAPLRIERVRQMDATVKYSAASIRSRDLPLRSASLTLKLDHGVLTLSPVTFGLQQGQINGDIKIDATKDVPYSAVDLRLTRARLEQFFTKAGSEPIVSGTLAARVKLAGSGDTVAKAAGNADGSVTFVVPRGQIRNAYAELMGIDVPEGLIGLLSGSKDQAGVRCMVANFSAKNGTLTASNFVFDTDAVVAHGSGTVDLKTERVNMKLEGAPKEFRVMRVRAPITMGGTLAHPSFGVDPSGAAVQTGAAVALGVFLSPLAAILPFVDPGLADDADCQGLLALARNKGASTRVAPKR
jgi:uncharacterized protein involved in outer membrane biogenesis